MYLSLPWGCIGTVIVIVWNSICVLGCTLGTNVLGRQCLLINKWLLQPFLQSKLLSLKNSKPTFLSSPHHDLLFHMSHSKFLFQKNHQFDQEIHSVLLFQAKIFALSSCSKSTSPRSTMIFQSSGSIPNAMSPSLTQFGLTMHQLESINWGPS